MNALKKITARAKQLQKKKPNAKWPNLIKEASKDYRSGMLGKAIGKVSVKVKSSKRKIPKIQFAVARKVVHAGMTRGAAKFFLKKDIESKLKNELFYQATAKLKTEKKAARKNIVGLKRDLRLLNKIV